MPSTIKLKFTDSPDINSSISLNTSYITNDLKETFRELRTASYQSTIVSGNINASRGEYINAFNADYNTSNLFAILTVGIDEVHITHPFFEFFTLGDVDNVIETNILVLGIDDTADTPQMNITDVSFTEAVSACDNVQLDVTTDILSVKYRINGGDDIANGDNPFSFEWVRGAFISLEVENADGDTDSENIQVPDALSVSNTTVSVVNSPSGATVTAVVTNILGLDLEYSLDDITYQDSNTFSSITEGSYTFYIKDQLGCSIEIPFEVADFNEGGIGVQFPIADLPSKSNSIRFAKYVDWGICTDYKNDENTLSCDLAYTLNPRHINQLFQECDIITTQIRSNYDSIVATVISDQFDSGTAGVSAKSNILLHSESADDAVWVEDKVTVTPNDISYPTGGYFGDKIHATTANGFHIIQQSLTKDANANDYTVSCYAKADELGFLVLFVQGSAPSSGIAYIFDTSTQTFDGLIEAGGYSLISASFTEPETGWYRVSMKFTSNTDTDIRVGIGVTDSATNIVFAGDNTSGLHVRGMQIQEGDLTDYIETTTTPVTIPAVPAVPPALIEYTIPVDQKSDNIGLKDKRDSIKYDLGNGQTGVYFTSGNTYDFDTDIINGTYALNGGLPQFGTIGNYLLIDLAWFQIIDILFDESKNAEVLVIDDNYTGVDVSVIVGSIYNAQDYDIYEFTIDMGDYPNQKIQVNITETDSDPNFEDVTFLSEIIDIKESHPKTVDITYFNDVNTDIFYSTGIVNKIRIPIEYYTGGFSGDTEAERTDINTILINAEVYENDEFHFDLLSKQIMRKVVQALSHKFVTINEVAYVKEDDPTSTPLVGTNLYRLVALMTKADSVYTSQGTGVEFVGAVLEVPNLLEQTSGGYIKYTDN